MYSLFSKLTVRSTFPLGVMMKITCMVVGLALALGATSALGQSNPRYVQFRPSATKGALYAPDSGPAPTVAFLAIHRTSNFMNMISTRELARRGFMVLGMNPRSDNNEAIVNFEDIALDIKQGVEFLRRQPGISRVILIGFSGGGPSTTFYQATAEKGLLLPGAEQARPVQQRLGGSTAGRRPAVAGRPPRQLREYSAQPQPCSA